MKLIATYFGRKSAAADPPQEAPSLDAWGSSPIHETTPVLKDWRRFDPLEPRFVALLARLDVLNQRT